MKYKKKAFFFVLFLLSTISFSSWAQPYVRIEELNQYVHRQYDSNGNPDLLDYYYNPTIKLYADSACTVPYTTTTNLDVTVDQSYYSGESHYPQGNYSGDYSFTVTIPSGNSSYSLIDDSYHSRYVTWQIDYDTNNNIDFISSFAMSFSILPGSGYEATPSVQRPYFESAEYNSQWPVANVLYRVYEPD